MKELINFIAELYQPTVKFARKLLSQQKYASAISLLVGQLLCISFFPLIALSWSIALTVWFIGFVLNSATVLLNLKDFREILN